MTRQAHIQLGIFPEFDRVVFCHLPEPAPRWCPTNVATLVKHWQTITDEQLARMFGCSVRRVVEKRGALGLLRKRPITTAELRHVEVNYQHSTYADIGPDIGRKPSSVGYIVRHLLRSTSPNGMRKREAA